MGLYIGNTKYKVMSGSSKTSLLSPTAYDSRVEYLGSTNTQYINTGLKNSDVDEYHIKFKAAYSRYRYVFGNYVNEQYECTRLLFTDSNDNRMYSNTGSMASKPNGSFGFIANDWNEAHGRVSNGIMYFKINAEEEVSRALESGTTNNNTISLFGKNSSSHDTVQIAEFTFKKNGNVILNLIPVRKGSVGYMYDTVSGRLFGNSGTGNFVLGPDKPIYDAEVEYLESTGTQWIDTLVEPSQNLAFSCSFAFEGITQAFGYGNIFGSRYASTSKEYQLTGYSNGCVSIGTRNSELGFYQGVINTVSFDGANTVNINGVSRSIITSTCSPTTGSIVLFGIRNNGAVAQLSKSKICSLKFILNGTLVRDFIPVRVGQVGYMYDTISHKLFGNAGTGQFIIGPDK